MSDNRLPSQFPLYVYTVLYSSYHVLLLQVALMVACQWNLALLSGPYLWWVTLPLDRSNKMMEKLNNSKQKTVITNMQHVFKIMKLLQPKKKNTVSHHSVQHMVEIGWVFRHLCDDIEEVFCFKSGGLFSKVWEGSGSFDLRICSCTTVIMKRNGRSY